MIRRAWRAFTRTWREAAAIIADEQAATADLFWTAVPIILLLLGYHHDGRNRP